MTNGNGNANDGELRASIGGAHVFRIALRHSSFVIRHSSFVIRHSSFVIRSPLRLRRFAVAEDQRIP
jgi:hypothetical protein